MSERTMPGPSRAGRTSPELKKPERIRSGQTSVHVWFAGAIGIVALLTGCGGGFFPPLAPASGGGGGTPGNTTGDFVYVANGTTNTIAGFAVATSTAGAGTLTAVAGSPYAFSFPPLTMAVTPTNSYLYVAGIGGIYAYAINGSTGVLTAANQGGAVAISQLGTVSIDISPDGQWLFGLAADGGTLNEYQINNTNGTLGVQPSVQYVVANGATVLPKMVRVAATGAYVALALGTGGDVVFPFNTKTGAFGTTYQQIPTGNPQASDNGLAIDSASTFLYLARSGAGSGVVVYGFGANGALSPVAGSPFAAGGGPFSMLLDSTGKYAYAANRTDGTITGYTIGTGGVLTALSGSPFKSGTSITSLARDKSGSYVLAAASGGTPDLAMYSFDKTTPGNLSSVATAATGADPTGPVAVVATH